MKRDTQFAFYSNKVTNDWSVITDEQRFSVENDIFDFRKRQKYAIEKNIDEILNCSNRLSMQIQEYFRQTTNHYQNNIINVVDVSHAVQSTKTRGRRRICLYTVLFGDKLSNSCSPVCKTQKELGQTTRKLILKLQELLRRGVLCILADFMDLCAVNLWFPTSINRSKSCSSYLRCIAYYLFKV